MTSPETLELEAVDAALAGRYVAPEHAELAELALLLRDDRPEPTLEWATHMDRRVEAGFPARPRQRPRLRLGAWWKPMAVVTSAAAPGRRWRSRWSAARLGPTTAGGGGGSTARPRQRRRRGAGGGEAPAAGDRPTRRRAGVEPRQRRQHRAAAERRRSPTRRPNRKVAAVRLADARRAAARHRQGREPGRRRHRHARRLRGRVRASAARAAATSSCACRPTGSTPRSSGSRSSPACATSRAGRWTSPPRSCPRATGSRTPAPSARACCASSPTADTVNETESIRARLDIVSQEIAAARNSLRRVNNRANFANVSVALVPRTGGEHATTAAPGRPATRSATRCACSRSPPASR